MRDCRPAASIRLFQIVGKACLLRRDRADHDGGEIGIARQQPAHRLHEHVACPSARAPGRSSRSRSGPAIRLPRMPRRDPAAAHRRSVSTPCGITVAATLEKRCRDIAGGDDRVHPPDQPARDPGVMALRRRGEHQFQRPAERAQQHADDHLVVAPRVPDQRRAAAPQFQRDQRPSSARCRRARRDRAMPRETSERVSAPPCGWSR